MRTTIFRNDLQLETTEVIDLFKKEISAFDVIPQNEAEELIETYRKYPTERFVISEQPSCEGGQGDICIFAEGTPMYNQIVPSMKNLVPTDNLVLQETDSLTGDHKVFTVEGSEYTMTEGTFCPPILENTPYRTLLKGKLFSTNKSFLIFHREHGNMVFPAGTYLFCSQLDSYTLQRAID